MVRPWDIWYTLKAASYADGRWMDANKSKLAIYPSAYGKFVVAIAVHS
jgi:hypothetical protein